MRIGVIRFAESQGLMYNTCMGDYWTMSDEGRERISRSAQKRYKDNSKIVTCLRCNAEYKVALSRWLNGRGRYCSKACMTDDFQGRHLAPETEFKKGFTPWNKGGRHPKVAGENHPDWKGDSVGYSGLHKWVKRTYGLREKCEHCGINEKLNLANKNGLYNRDPDNWLTLCKRCHIIFDNNDPKHPPYEMRKGW